MRPKVKICGVTTPADAAGAVRCGATYVGLNFYAPSPRSLSLDAARDVRAAIGSDAQVVGVFVDTPRPEIERFRDELDLDWVQLHGNEAPADVEHFGSSAIKAFRMGESFSQASVEPFAGAGAFLFDTPSAVAAKGALGEELYGGTGTSWRYETVQPFLRAPQPIFVAGGISPANVATVARTLPGVHAVDVCSGVEERPGVKDPRLVESLFEEIAAAA